MATARRARATPTTTRRASRRQTGPAPGAHYSDAYPIAGGHSYLVKSIPRPIFEAAQARAAGENGRSVRNVIIRALELYGAGKLRIPASAPARPALLLREGGAGRSSFDRDISCGYTRGHGI